MLGLAAVPAVIMFFGVLGLPESPRFLVKAKRFDDAKDVLRKIRANTDDAEAELKEITLASLLTVSPKNVEYRFLFKRKYRYLVIAGICVAAFQQFMGANAIFYYIPLIVEKATGEAASSALLWPIVQGVILVAGAIFFIVIADKFKRRTLLTLGGIVMALSFFMPAILNTILGENFPPMMIVVFLSIYVAFYSFT